MQPLEGKPTELSRADTMSARRSQEAKNREDHMIGDPWQPRITSQRLLREVFTAWWQRAWVWLGMGALVYILLRWYCIAIFC